MIEEKAKTADNGNDVFVSGDTGIRFSLSGKDISDLIKHGVVSAVEDEVFSKIEKYFKLFSIISAFALTTVTVSAYFGIKNYISQAIDKQLQEEAKQLIINETRRYISSEDGSRKIVEIIASGVNGDSSAENMINFDNAIARSMKLYIEKISEEVARKVVDQNKINTSAAKTAVHDKETTDGPYSEAVYRVIIASYTGRQYALSFVEQAVATLKSKNLQDVRPILCDPTLGNDKIVVAVGKFQTVKSAEDVRLKLISAGFPPNIYISANTRNAYSCGA
ncbi:hypothetical protein FBZ82_101671 [Azospirillum brasilense]|uniref:SPOR domain-containing protein n=1 Tax=Azospirillum brasilense TaxID=192 RepID=A0A560BPV8_AZOBR|nr:hypothetical protein [Azospirillum brasilense]TWA74655.1 hypothetical protein FBZ82_101671 [Azospirillum brasilense]